MAIVRRNAGLWLGAMVALGGCTGNIGGQASEQATAQTGALTWTDGALTMTVEADVEPVRCEATDPTLGVSGSITVAGSGTLTAVAMVTNVDTGEVSRITLASASDFSVDVNGDRVASFATDVLLLNGAHNLELCFALVTPRGLSRTGACLPAFDYDVDCTTPVDTTPPTITGSRSPEANAFGWNNTDVTASFVCEDLESGIASCTAPVVVSTEDAGQSVTGEAVDNAGNSAQATVSGINIDKTAPSVVLVGASNYLVDETVSVTCDISDELSGIQSSTCSGASGDAYTFGLGSHEVAASAVDNADNEASAAGSFTVVVTADSLCNLIERFVSRAGVANSLCQKLTAAEAAAADDRVRAARNIMRAFDNELRAQSRRTISSENADLIADLADALLPTTDDGHGGWGWGWCGWHGWHGWHGWQGWHHH